MAIVVIGLLIFVLPVAGIYGLIYYSFDFYPRFGRMTDFKPVDQASLALPNSTYNLLTSGQKYADQSYAQSSQFGNSTVPMKYLIFSQSKQTYLIMRTYSDGTDGMYHYEIVNVSAVPPRVLGAKDSCTYPRLDGDSLEFEHFTTTGCDDGSPLLNQIESETVKLN